MPAISLLIALLFAAPAGAGEYETKLAIALALAEETAVEKSVVTDHIVPERKNVAQQYTTRTRWVRERFNCHSGMCSYRWVKVTERVPVATATKSTEARYPVTDGAIYRLDGGKGLRVDWRHLTQGDHANVFDVNYLKSLPDAELQQLHSDHHRNRVNWQFAKRPQPQEKK